MKKMAAKKKASIKKGSKKGAKAKISVKKKTSLKKSVAPKVRPPFPFLHSLEAYVVLFRQERMVADSLFDGRYLLTNVHTFVSGFGLAPVCCCCCVDYDYEKELAKEEANAEIEEAEAEDAKEVEIILNSYGAIISRWGYIDQYHQHASISIDEVNEKWSNVINASATAAAGSSYAPMAYGYHRQQHRRRHHRGRGNGWDYTASPIPSMLHKQVN
jgi:hypothetical protein